MSTRRLTTTSYAVLSLLAIRPWAVYDLAKLMRRSLHYFWPRAESNLYAEPKRLVEAGYAEAHEEWTGERKRSVYSITESGRTALGEWLATPPAGQRLESEPHLRLLFANYGTKNDLLATIGRVEADADEVIEHYLPSAASMRGARDSSPSAFTSTRCSRRSRSSRRGPEHTGRAGLEPR